MQMTLNCFICIKIKKIELTYFGTYQKCDANYRNDLEIRLSYPKVWFLKNFKTCALYQPTKFVFGKYSLLQYSIFFLTNNTKKYIFLGSKF